MPDRTADISAVALLDEPVRRALYDWVIAQETAAGRDEAAAGVGVSRGLAAFHLDRLVEDGLLVAEYRRLSGRTGPGAGRPAKLYRRGPREVAVSLPERTYDVAAGLFAEAIEKTGGPLPPEPLQAGARQVGEAVGAVARERVGGRPSRRRLREALIHALDDRGYEPRETEADEIHLGNCPFHALVEEHRQLVCGMNLALAEGLLAGLGYDSVKARMDPQPGQCCIAIGRVGEGVG
jgi:predicted ArsR family transcriptional regulator